MKQLIDWSSSATGAGLFSDNLVLRCVWKHLDRGDSATKSVARLGCLKCLYLNCRSLFLKRELDAKLSAVRRKLVTDLP